jgi:tetratricopeptide (TPR) repeat protein
MNAIDAFLHKAQLLLEHGRPSEAEKQLINVLQQEPENPQGLTLLARCKYEQRQYMEGIAIIQRAIKLSPLEDYYFYLLAFGNYQQNNNKAAQQDLARAIELNPYSPDYFGLFALILIEEKNFKRALATANEGLAIDAENITCLNARSTALNKMRRTDDAIKTMQNALDQDPENDFTHTTVGWNLLEKGRNRDATKHFKEALRLNPSLEGARVGLKESLKSKILPYKWLLHYSFWINNQGKKARWAIPLALFLIVRLIAGATGSGKDGFGWLGGIIIGVYLLFVATSWIINPLANFFLLFNNDGKYALTNNEKWNAILLISSFFITIILFLSSLYSRDAHAANGLQIAALIALSLSFPLGHMQIPIRFTDNSRLQWYSILLVTGGLVALILSVLNLEWASNVIIPYGLVFIAYTWMHAFSVK